MTNHTSTGPELYRSRLATFAEGACAVSAAKNSTEKYHTKIALKDCFLIEWNVVNLGQRNPGESGCLEILRPACSLSLSLPWSRIGLSIKCRNTVTVDDVNEAQKERELGFPITGVEVRGIANPLFLNFCEAWLNRRSFPELLNLENLSLPEPNPPILNLWTAKMLEPACEWRVDKDIRGQSDREAISIAHPKMVHLDQDSLLTPPNTKLFWVKKNTNFSPSKQFETIQQLLLRHTQNTWPKFLRDTFLFDRMDGVY